MSSTYNAKSTYNANESRLQRRWNYIRVLLMHLEIFKAHFPLHIDVDPDLPCSVLRQSWCDLWATTAASLQRFASVSWLEREANGQLALQCFELLDGFEDRMQQTAAAPTHPKRLDANTSRSATWTRVSQKSPFPDELYAALVMVVPNYMVPDLASFHYIQERLPESHREPSLCTATGTEASGARQGVEANDSVPTVRPLTIRSRENRGGGC